MTQRADWKDFSALKDVAKKLETGAVVAGSSDTVLGLLSAATDTGKAKLDQIKKRSDMPYLVLVSDLVAARKLSPFLQSETGAQLARTFWPGPLTLIVPAGKDVPSYLQSATRGIAIRVPDHAGLQQLLSHTGMLFSTSANISGSPVPQQLSDLDPVIAGQVSYLIEGENGQKAASTIVDCMQDPIRVIREGSISKELLEDYL